MRHIAALLLLVAPALLAAPARAQLVEVDLLAPGDKLVTRDTDTNLDWLDLENVTQGLSHDAIQSGTGGWLASGWRYATEAEVCHLWTGHAGAASCDSFAAPVDPTQAQNVITLLGRTGTNTGGFITVFLRGLYDDQNGGASVGLARLEVTTPVAFPPGPFSLVTDATPDAVASSTASPIVGSFLVRTSPPVIPALPPAGVAALAALLGIAARAVQLRTRGVK